MQIDDILTPSPPSPVTKDAASLFVDHDDILEEAHDLMVDNGVNMLPVLGGAGTPVGSVSYHEVLRGLRDEGRDDIEPAA